MTATITLVGSLGREPELRYSSGGRRRCRACLWLWNRSRYEGAQVLEVAA